METEKTKEVVVLEKKVNLVVSDVKSITIVDDETMLHAADIRKQVKFYAKEVKEEKEKATKPLKEVVKTITSWFAPMETECELAISQIEGKMRVYQNAVDEKKRKIEAEAQKKIDDARKALEEGTMSAEKAEKVVAKAEAKVEAAPEVITKSADFHTRMIPKVRFAELKTLSDKEIVILVRGEYLVWDNVKARKDALAGIVIPGTEVYEESSFV